MRRALVEVYLHLIWATWDRLPLLAPPLDRLAHRTIAAQATALGATVVAVNGLADHVHLLVQLPATCTVAQLMQRVKGASTHLLHQQQPAQLFKWQGGYAAFSVSPRSVGTVKDSILRQQEHHAQHRPLLAWEDQVLTHPRCRRKHRLKPGRLTMASTSCPLLQSWQSLGDFSRPGFVVLRC